MGNHSSTSASKRRPADVNGQRKTASGESQWTRDNDLVATMTTSNELVDPQSAPANSKPDFRRHRPSFIVAGGHAATSNVEQRRSPATSTGQYSDHSETARTLPRSFGRSRSSVASDAARNEVVLRQRHGTSSKRRPTSDYNTADVRSIHKPRPLSSLGVADELPELQKAFGEYKPQPKFNKKAVPVLPVHRTPQSEGNDPPVVSPKFHQVPLGIDERIEFPDSITIQRRTDAFQRRFVEHFVAIFSSLPTSVQVSVVSVAERRHQINHVEVFQPLPPVVSLEQYLGAAAESSSVEVSFQLPDSEYALTITPDCLDLIQRIRVEGSADPAATARRIVSDVTAEAAVELARVFEYQLVLLGDEEGLGARQAAQRAAQRAVDYLKRIGRHVNVNTVIRGVVDGRPTEVAAPVSAVVGPHRHLKWNVDDVFQRPGLRRERLLVAGGIDAIGGYGTPWRFYATSDSTDATLYGYRGQLLTRDFHSERLRDGGQRLYHLDADEEAAYNIEVPCRAHDFHRTYRPHRRLIGSAVMAGYEALSDDDKLTRNVSEYVQQLQGDAFRRDGVEPVFRPLTNPTASENSSTVTALPDTVPWNNRQTESFSVATWKTGINQIPRSSPTLLDNAPVRKQSVNYFYNGDTPDSSQKNENVQTLSPTLTQTALTPKQASHVWNGNTSNDEHGVSTTTPKRCTPPAVKPKPVTELRRQASAVSSPHGSVESLGVAATRSVNQRQTSVAVDGGDFASPVRFPTLEELFGRDLAASRKSAHLPGTSTDSGISSRDHQGNSCPVSQDSRNATSTLSEDNTDGTVAPTRLLVSDI